MPRCKGLHCPGCRHGGGSGAGAGALLFLALILIAAVLVRPVKHAASSALHMVMEVAEIAALVVVSAVGLAVVCGLVVAGARIRRWMLARPSCTVSIERPVHSGLQARAEPLERLRDPARHAARCAVVVGRVGRGDRPQRPEAAVMMPEINALWGFLSSRVAKRGTVPRDSHSHRL